MLDPLATDQPNRLQHYTRLFRRRPSERWITAPHNRCFWTLRCRSFNTSFKSAHTSFCSGSSAFEPTSSQEARHGPLRPRAAPTHARRSFLACVPAESMAALARNATANGSEVDRAKGVVGASVAGASVGVFGR